MSEYFFGLHSGHLKAKADHMAARHGAVHVNYTEPNGEKRGWFACRNYGSPFNEDTARAVMADIERIGGLNSLRYKRCSED